MHGQAPRPKQSTASEQDKSQTISKKVVKWIGLFTAILSLAVGLQQISKVVLDGIHKDKQINALLAAEEEELKGRDYRAAWSTLEQASAIDGDSTKVKVAQEVLAMEWLENIRIADSERFSDITKKLEPVLIRGAASSSSAAHRGDLLAHIGWSYFLQTRDGVGGLDPVVSYARAVSEDAHNPYAEAMWGHWILWNGGSMGVAMQHFDAALSSGRQRDFVRKMELSALLNHHENGFDEEALRVINQVRKENGTISEKDRQALLANYGSRMLPPRPDTNAFVGAIPATEHLDTFHWLFDGMGPDVSRTYYLAVVEEAAGDREEALNHYRSVLSSRGKQNGTIFEAAGIGLKRLSSK